MVTKFEVKTIHTKRVLADFVSFSYKIKHPKTTFRLIMMAICMAICTYVAKDVEGMIKFIFAGLTLLLLFFTFFRKYIAVSRLSKMDYSHTNNSAIDYVFAERTFSIANMEAGEKIIEDVYGAITAMYEDKDNYYLSINNEEIHLLPKRDFTVGEADSFKSFITKKTGREFSRISIPFKERIAMAEAAQEERYKANQKAKEAKRERKQK